MTRNLSSSVIKKFNGYKTIKHKLACKEQIDLVPLCIIHDSSYSEKAPVLCFFSDQIHLAYNSHGGKIVDGKEKTTHPISRQCPFCEKIFSKSAEAMKKHTNVCAAKEGITCTFDNGNIQWTLSISNSQGTNKFVQDREIFEIEKITNKAREVNKGLLGMY